MKGIMAEGVIEECKGKRVQIGKLIVKEWRESQEKTVLIIGLQEQDMGDLLLHWIGATRTDKDLFHLNKLPIPELVMRCLVISTPSNVSSPSPIILIPLLKIIAS